MRSEDLARQADLAAAHAGRLVDAGGYPAHELAVVLAELSAALRIDAAAARSQEDLADLHAEFDGDPDAAGDHR